MRAVLLARRMWAVRLAGAVVRDVLAANVRVRDGDDRSGRDGASRRASRAGAGMSLTIAPIGLRAANDYVTQLHRHHGPTRGHKFSIACLDGDRLCGVAIAGRPVARSLDDGSTLEVLRVCTDGTPNACSKLYGAMRRTAREMGYRKVITYTLAEESGVSLRAAGWIMDGTTRGGSWDRPNRERTDRHPVGPKFRWAA